MRSGCVPVTGFIKSNQNGFYSESMLQPAVAKIALANVRKENAGLEMLTANILHLKHSKLKFSTSSFHLHILANKCRTCTNNLYFIIWPDYFPWPPPRLHQHQHHPLRQKPPSQNLGGQHFFGAWTCRHFLLHQFLLHGGGRPVLDTEAAACCDIFSSCLCAWTRYTSCKSRAKIANAIKQ